jgi:outer membrane protein assembly factor BamB
MVCVVFIGTSSTLSKSVNIENDDLSAHISKPLSETDWWPMFHHDIIHTRFSSSTSPSTNNLKWIFNAGSAVRSSPAISDGKVYFGNSDNGKKIFCLDANDGSEIWNYTIMGWNIISSPAISDGKVYIGGAYDDRIYCLDANDGSEIWNYTTGYIVYSSPTVSNGRVYIGSHDTNVYCLDAENGSKIWNFTTGDYVISSPAIYDNRLYIGSKDQNVYCLNVDDGSEIWNFTTGVSLWGVWASPTVVEGKVYIGALDEKIFCLNAADGSEIWNKNVGDWIYSTVAFSTGRIYFGTNNKNVFCLDADDGSEIWKFSTKESITSSPAISDGKIFIGSNDDNIYCLDANDGSEIWNFTTDGSIYSSPAVADGNVYVCSRDGYVYCFGEGKLYPDLECNGELTWNKLKPLSNRTGSFTVKNIGDPGSLLNWEIVDWPEWGEWTFTPMKGNNLRPKDGEITVNVSLDLSKNAAFSYEKECNRGYTGEVKIVNKENSSDFCTIKVYLRTNKNRFFNTPFLNWINSHLFLFPILQKLLV